MGDFDFLEPIPKTVVQVKLPSRGVCYPKGTPAASGKLSLSPMTMAEEALFGDTRGTSTETIDTILRHCIQENIELNTLLAADKFYLFMMLRAVTYGQNYTFSWNCPAVINARETCGAKNTTTVRIPEDFKAKYLADEDKEPFVVRLPDSQKNISFRLLRGYDEPVIDKYTKHIENQRKLGIGIPNTTNAFRIVRQIVAVDGKPVKEAPEEKMIAFVLSLSAKDTQYLRDKIAHFTPGISTDVVLVCDTCHATHEWDLPFTADFFRAVYPSDEVPVADEIRPDVLSEDVSERNHGDGSPRA
jgi:hypothetical protein